MFYFTILKNTTVLIEQNDKMLAFNEFVSTKFRIYI